MLYSKRNHVSPRNNTRQAHYRRAAENYERTAQKLHNNSIEAAAFEVVYYSQRGSGTSCSCSTEAPQDPLNHMGQMDAPMMAAVLESIDTDVVQVDNRNRRFRLDDYGKDQEDPVIEEEDDGLIEDVEYDDDDRDGADFDNNGDEVLNGMGVVLPPHSPSVTNCAVCNKTGFVGGFNRYGGARMVWAVPDWIQATITNIAPNLGARPAHFEVGDGTGTCAWTAILPKKPFRVAVIRLMDNFTPLQMGTDFELSVNGEVITNLTALLEYCTGELVTLSIESAYNFTHFELEFELLPEKLSIDASNWSLQPSQQSLNDFSELQVNIPPKIPFVRRGDILFEKTSRVGWVISGAEPIRSSIMGHGHSANITRINERFDAYAMQNPFAAAGVNHNTDRKSSVTAKRSSEQWVKPVSPEPTPPDTVPDWGEW